MGIQEFDSEDELEAAADRFEELCFKKLELEEAVKDARQDLEYAEQELENFLSDNPEI